MGLDRQLEQVARRRSPSSWTDARRFQCFCVAMLRSIRLACADRSDQGGSASAWAHPMVVRFLAAQRALSRAHAAASASASPAARSRCKTLPVAPLPSAASRRRARRVRAIAASVLAVAGLACSAGPARARSPQASGSRFSIPASARQLIVVSSPTYDPPDYLASFRSFQRASASSPWKPVFAAWQAEIGSGELRDVRREGDHATPTGVYPFGLTMYGNEPNPGGLHETYHHLVCGDWWDEDPYSASTTGSCTCLAGRHRLLRPGPRRSGPRRRPIPTSR